MFSRTDVGISVEHRFYGVDQVVYCEGRTRSQDIDSVDEYYWKEVFDRFGNVKIKCKSMGSKSDLLTIVDRIVSGRLTNIIVALDRDYDEYFDSLVDHPQVVYTYGYSFESDCCQDLVVKSVLPLFVTLADCDNIEQEFNLFLENNRLQMKRFFLLDLKYAGNPRALFDHQKPMSIIEVNERDAPFIRKQQLLDSAKRIGRFQAVKISKKVTDGICGYRSFFGKGVVKLLYQWFVLRWKNVSGSRKTPYETFLVSLITSANYQIATQKNEYYRDMIATSLGR